MSDPTSGPGRERTKVRVRAGRRGGGDRHARRDTKQRRRVKLVVMTVLMTVLALGAGWWASGRLVSDAAVPRVSDAPP